MKRILFCMVISSVVTSTCVAQIKFKNPLGKSKSSSSTPVSTVTGATGTVTGTSASGATGTNLTDNEAGSAVKELLSLSAQGASTKASRLNGFFGDAEIKIFFPPEAREMEKKLRSIGLSKEVDEAIVAMNRAAEEACLEAWPAFSNAITKMTINDASHILMGPPNAGTAYMEKTTRPDLTVTFTPIVKRALVKVAITRYWNPLISKYNAIPLVKKINPDLDAYVTQMTLNGLFKLMAKEEAKIRQNPAMQASGLLKKALGKI